MRERIGTIATDAARAVGYRGAGTIEGLLAGGEYFFLEMNTRVQVEHCVTEMTTGIDIVKTGIRVAAGEPLPFAPGGRRAARPCDRVPDQRRGRLAALHADPGRIATTASRPGPGVRVDSGVGAGSEISPTYDPMVAKLIVWDTDREAATRAHAPRPARVRDQRPDDAAAVPRAAPGDRAVGARRDLPRPARGRRVARRRPRRRAGGTGGDATPADDR